MIGIFEITDQVIDKSNVTEEQKKHVEKLFTSALKDSGLGKANDRIYFEVNSPKEESVFNKFNGVPNSENREDYIRSLFSKLANDLLYAELIADEGRRNANITQGILFIKFRDNILTILKLEELEIIEKESYELKDSFGIGTSYFKAAWIRRSICATRIAICEPPSSLSLSHL